MKLWGVMHHTALAFSKLLCLAQGGSSNYLANILITSHISHTAGGNKMKLGAHIQLSVLYKFVSRVNSLQHIEFSIVLSCSKTSLPPRFFFVINLLMTAGITASFAPIWDTTNVKMKRVENKHMQCIFIV